MWQQDAKALLSSHQQHLFQLHDSGEFQYIFLMHIQQPIGDVTENGHTKYRDSVSRTAQGQNIVSKIEVQKTRDFIIEKSSSNGR